ncbi:MAG: hypothetical protein HS101_18310 [Planctomycetia bacterium]|nr:hypothetical protein [Planctomycetia bacterium]
MEEFVDSKMWLTRGSSVIFDKIMLGPLLNDGALISLRQALSWLSSWPSAPPTSGRTVLLGGLDTVLEVLPTRDAEDFVRRQIRPLIAEFQNRWTECGLVFGMNTPAPRIVEDPVTEMVHFENRDGERLCLSTELWNGSAVTDMRRLVRTDRAAGQKVRGGYYAPRS